MKILYKYNYYNDSRHEQTIDYTNQKIYKFEFGKEYRVMGVGFTKKNLNTSKKDTFYFLLKVGDRIEWFPDFLFVYKELRFSRIPFNWTINKNDVFDFIMGYYELVNSFEHFYGLRKRKVEDIEIFEKRYEELEEWEKTLNYYDNEITLEDILSKIEF